MVKYWKSILAIAAAAVLLAGCAGRGALLAGVALLQPHAIPSGTIEIYPCTQVGFSANSCFPGKGVPTSGELSAFTKFVDAEAARGYRWMGASGILGFSKATATQSQIAEYYVFQAP